jgi:hypothetical protein
LTSEELAAVSPLLNYGTPTPEVKKFISNSFGKFVTTDDVVNMRRRVNPELFSK